MLAIVIPTIDRSDLLCRQLTYYADVGCKHTIYVGDSSMGQQLKQTQQAIRALSDRIKIVHLELPGANDHEAMYALLERVEEPYTAHAGDDDFLVPNALEECKRFLDAHPDCSTAHGVAAVCGVKLGGDNYEIRGSGHYRLGTEEHDSAGQRLMAYMSNYFETVFAVHRTEELRRDVNTTLSMPHTKFRNLLACCSTIVRGKAKQLDCFYLVRLTHDRQHVSLDMMDWITSPDWSAAYEVFRDTLSEELVRQDRITLIDAQATVKQAFWTYLAKGLTRDGRTRSELEGIAAHSRLRRTVRNRPLLRKTYHAVRSHFPGKENRFSLPALLRRSSPYHADFMPVYRAITAASGQPGQSVI